jgi:hypothetical protein
MLGRRTAAFIMGHVDASIATAIVTYDDVALGFYY